MPERGENDSPMVQRKGAADSRQQEESSEEARNEDAARDYLASTGRYQNVDAMTREQVARALRWEGLEASGANDHFEDVTGISADNLTAEDIEKIVRANPALFGADAVKRHDGWEEAIEKLPKDVQDAIHDPGGTIIPDDLDGRVLIRRRPEPGGGGAGSGDPMNPRANQPPSNASTAIPIDPRDARLRDRLDGGRGAGSGADGAGGTDSGAGQSSPGGQGTSTGQGSGATNSFGGSSGSREAPAGGGEPGGGSPGTGSSGESGSEGGGSSGTSKSGGPDSEGGGSSGPPEGSSRYGRGIVGVGGMPVGAESGWRDENGNWYNDDGTPMGAEKAERMEKAYDEGEAVFLDSNDSGSTDSSSSGEEGSSGEGGSSDESDDGDSDTANEGEGEGETPSVEYTPSGDRITGTGTSDSPAAAAFRDYVEVHRSIVEEARSGSLVNPAREGGAEHGSGTPAAGATLVGPDGDTRLDGAAQNAGTGTAGTDWGNSAGAGAIDYGPDANVDYGEGLTEDMPTEFGPSTPVSVPGITDANDGSGEPPATGRLPGGVSPGDLRTGPGLGSMAGRAGPPGGGLHQPPTETLGPPASSTGGSTTSGDATPPAPGLDVFWDQAGGGGRSSGEVNSGLTPGDSGSDEGVRASDDVVRPNLRDHLEPKFSREGLKGLAISQPTGGSSDGGGLPLTGNAGRDESFVRRSQDDLAASAFVAPDTSDGRGGDDSTSFMGESAEAAAGDPFDLLAGSLKSPGSDARIGRGGDLPSLSPEDNDGGRDDDLDS